MVECAVDVVSADALEKESSIREVCSESVKRSNIELEDEILNLCIDHVAVETMEVMKELSDWLINGLLSSLLQDDCDAQKNAITKEAEMWSEDIEEKSVESIANMVSGSMVESAVDIVSADALEKESAIAEVCSESVKRSNIELEDEILNLSIDNVAVETMEVMKELSDCLINGL